MLYPENLPLVDDLVSILRLVLALLKTSNTALLLLMIDVPTGLKNPTSET
jgi:3-deoxy-7-phosphoheptulonate synthase